MKPNYLYAILISLIAALGGFLLGFDSAVISGATPYYKVTFGLDTGSWLIGLSVSSIILGSIGGNLIAGPLADRYGRKKVLLITAFLFACCALGTALAHNIVFFIAARIVGGVGVGMAILVAPMYIAEIAPRKWRGTLVTLNQLNIVLGIFVAYFSNYFIQRTVSDTDLSWRWMLGVGLVPAGLYFLFLFFVPRSPRWLIRKKFDEEALKVLIKINGKHHADSVFKEIRTSLEAECKNEKGSLAELFSRKMKWVLLIGLGIAFFQQITGINAIFYYAPMIFEMAGDGKDTAFMQAIILGLTNVVMTVIAMFLIDRLGRKPLLIIGSVGIFISLSIVGVSFITAHYSLTEYNLSGIVSELQKSGKSDDCVELTELLEPMLGKTYKKETIFFDEVRNTIGKDFYNSYKEVIIKNCITINSVGVLIGLILFVASFAISLGPVMWTLFSEIFPNKLRGLAISLAGFWNSIVSFSIATVFPLELEYLGSGATYLIYAVFGFLTLLFVAYFIPETKGKSLEEIEKQLVRK
ncbi:MAG: sugar porter family MFS transporter [Bacteroidota bacterium]